MLAGFELTQLRLQHSAGPFLSSLNLLLCEPSPIAGRPYSAATEILLPARLRPLQPPAIPQFLTTCSRVTGLCHQFQERVILALYCGPPHIKKLKKTELEPTA